ncbi:stage VI sporulation protein D [Litchfieldia salsa]|uniref:Stage VI sporulation protein D n=1 Tax=Litchfieldia salsa TaxID=930152 RepID=A0A1H0NVJ0_9BACI|nr:stage VI sporulation protein D [Litchfieldia salsa]SDO96536.1 stage VI sporulation protein D [Litchfieldia salsa]
MTSENKSYLRFSVEESVWFQKGQEVSELVSIALDPNIVIQEHDQYVSIRGALQLTGEYRIDETASEEDERDFTSVRIVNEVITREDGVSELTHNFPVDITIPKNRIQNMDDVYVAIESFDYELPKRGCLELVADLSISGIYGSQQSVPSVEDSQEEIEPIELNYPSSYSPERDEEVVEAVTEEPPVEEVEEEVVNAVEEQPVKEVEQEQELELAFRGGKEDQLESPPEINFNSAESPEENDLSPRALVNEQDSESGEVETVNMNLYAVPDHSIEESEEDLYTPFEVEARKEIYSADQETEVLQTEESNLDESVPEVLNNMEPEEVIEEVIEPVTEIEPEPEPEPEPVKQPQLQVELKGRPEGNYNFGTVSNRRARSAVEEQEKAEQGEEAPAKRNENALYLTKIFTREHEEDFTKMKICIAQHNDSLETISERYEVSVQSLLRVNQLTEDNHINDGQLLYIPVPK